MASDTRVSNEYLPKDCINKCHIYRTNGTQSLDDRLTNCSDEINNVGKINRIKHLKSQDV